jgi:LAO/AO transport system kinase
MSSKHPHINPSFVRRAKIELSYAQCVEGMQEGNYQVLAYLISKAESKLPEDQDFVQKLLVDVPVSRFVRKLAISGAPGVGKSSFLDSFGSFLLEDKKRIAVLPVDPSSYVSKGSILGDKTRMERLTRSENAFIKPMPSALALGGLAPATAAAAMICERANFDYILIETVGVGQSEVEARDIVDMFILLLQPGGGDDLQGIKRGIMELADLFIVTKADGSLLESAKTTRREIRQILGLLVANTYGWKAQVMSHSAQLDKGNSELLDCIDGYFDYMDQNKRLEKLRHSQGLQFFKKQSRQLMIDYVSANEKIGKLLRQIHLELERGKLLPVSALKKLDDLLDDLF